MTRIKDAGYSFPKNIITLEHETYALADQAAADALHALIETEVDDELSAGWTLKDSIFDAADKAAVDAVVDSR